MQKLILGLMLFILCEISLACYRPPVTIAELNGQPIIRVLSENAKYLLEMHPAKWVESNDGKWESRDKKLAVVRDSLGIIYSVAENGEMKPVWEVAGIYPREFRTGKFPYHPEKLTFYISNEGNKVIRVLDRFWKSKSQFSIYEQSGKRSMMPLLIPGLAVVYGCGLLVLSSHNLRADGVSSSKL